MVMHMWRIIIFLSFIWKFLIDVIQNHVHHWLCGRCEISQVTIDLHLFLYFWQQQKKTEKQNFFVLTNSKTFLYQLTILKTLLFHSLLCKENHQDFLMYCQNIREDGTAPYRNEYTPGIMSSICMLFLTNVDYLHQTLIYHSFWHTWYLYSIKFAVLLVFLVQM